MLSVMDAWRSCSGSLPARTATAAALGQASARVAHRHCTSSCAWLHLVAELAASGGDLGEFERGKMQKPFEEAAFALQPGEMSGVVDTDSGVHLILRLR